ncbi:related to carboxypeptidase [Cephalotrichum gorgonifer]|uniref:Inactive metallocarboxypeptidase ECM14 n=1 Tax=Cephalotrichum gorgonifer TaxID=2041049 RepID=A0AAE8MRH0_9PEZI|nr:related to carboxypeptidase [Cephalotrichum gorgonifer]
MWLPRIAVVSLLALPVLSDPLWASARDPRRSSRQSSAALRDGSTDTNPSLKRLRDYVVELVFGKPASAVPAQPARRNIWAAYGNDIVVRFNLTEPHEEAAIADAVDRLFKDVWSYGDEYVDIQMHRDDIAPFLSLLPESLQYSYSILIPDLASLVYNSYPSKFLSEGYVDVSREVYSPSRSQLFEYGENVFFENYQPLPVIVRWMRLVEALFPSFVNVISVGKSYEGRDILGLRVGSPETPGSPDRPRKTIVVTGGIHAREWISTTTVNYVAWSFITHNQKDPIVTKFLKHFDIVFLPVLNPDGFEYTWQVDRLWRKTRQPTPFRFCRGVDLDRAFGYEWGEAGDPCSEFYGGSEPFEATEAQQLADWAEKAALNHTRIVGLIDLHSYSQQVLFPYSFSCREEPPNLENLEELAAGLAKAIRLQSGESYSIRSACESAVSSGRRAATSQIEIGGGSVIDWFYHELHARYSYQIRLRDTGSYGFLLPSESIVPTGEEIFYAFRYLGDFLLGNNGIERLSDSSDSPKSHPADSTNEEGRSEEEPAGWGELKR